MPPHTSHTKANQPLRLFFSFPLKACVGKGTNIYKKLEILAHECQFLKEDLEIGKVIQLLERVDSDRKGTLQRVAIHAKGDNTKMLTAPQTVLILPSALASPGS